MTTSLALRQTRHFPRGHAATRNDPLGLTPRERQVAMLLYAGKGAPAIARELGIGYSTVRRFLKDAYRKLGVHSQLELVARIRLEQQTQVLSEPFLAEVAE